MRTMIANPARQQNRRACVLRVWEIRSPRVSLHGSKSLVPRVARGRRHELHRGGLADPSGAMRSMPPYLATEVTAHLLRRLIPPAGWVAFRVVVVAYLLVLPLYYADLLR